jgi:hypothetical protein
MTVVELPAVRTPLLVAVFELDAQVFWPPEYARTLAVVRSSSWGPKAFNVVHNVLQFVRFGEFPRCDFDGRNI